jgi:hypothetical protein
MNSVERVAYTTTQTPQEKASVVSEIPRSAFISIDNEYKEKIDKESKFEYLRKNENISDIITDKEIYVENLNSSISKSYLPTSDRYASVFMYIYLFIY